MQAAKIHVRQNLNNINITKLISKSAQKSDQTKNPKHFYC